MCARAISPSLDGEGASSNTDWWRRVNMSTDLDVFYQRVELFEFALRGLPQRGRGAPL